MGNAIEYECKECHYWDAIHGINGFFITQEQFKKCSHCAKPTKDRMGGHGIYPPNDGGITIEEECMFKFAGKEALDGVKEKLAKMLSGIDPEKINAGISSLGEKIPILGVFVKGYNAMSPEEQGEFAKNIMIAGAKAAAKL